MAFTAPVTRATDFLVTAAVWNAEHVDNMNTAWPHLIVRKTSDQSVTSSTVLVNDSALVMTVAANEIWQMEWWVRYEAASTGDMKVAFTFPTAGEVNFAAVWQDQAGAVALSDFFSTTSPTGSFGFHGAGASNPKVLRIHGVYVNGANSGSVQLQWAQNTSDATPTKVRANSTLWAVKLA